MVVLNLNLNFDIKQLEMKLIANTSHEQLI